MVHRLVVSYGQPEDAGAFDEYYRDTHTPLAKRIPGLIGLSIGRPESLDPAQPAPYLVAQLDFESAEAMGAALGSAEGQAAAADVANFATGGAVMHQYEVNQVV